MTCVPSMGAVQMGFKSPCVKIEMNRNEQISNSRGQGGTGDRVAKKRLCECHGRASGNPNAKPERIDGGTESNPHVRWCGRGDGRNPVTSTRLASSILSEGTVPPLHCSYGLSEIVDLATVICAVHFHIGTKSNLGTALIKAEKGILGNAGGQCRFGDVVPLSILQSIDAGKLGRWQGAVSKGAR